MKVVVKNSKVCSHSHRYIPQKVLFFSEVLSKGEQHQVPLRNSASPDSNLKHESFQI